MIFRAFIPIMFLIGLSACATIGPQYEEPPKPGFELSWTELAQSNAAAGGELTSDWWNIFNDPQLTALVETATVKNYDIRDAFLRINEARAALRATQGQGLPNIGSRGSGQRTQVSENGQIPIGQIPGANVTTNIYDIGVSANWEIDLFGRVRRAVEASGARADVANELYNGVLLSIQAETAIAYFELRGLEGQIGAVNQAIAVRKKSLELVALQVKAGTASQYSLSQAKSGLRQLRTQLPPLQAAKKQSLYRLGVLTGQSPAEAEQAIVIEKIKAMPAIAVPVGLPSDLLLRRPDIRQAERSLAAETAEVGVALGNRLPRFSLTGTAGLQATDFGDIFKGDSVRWSLGGLFDFTLPFFAGNRLNEEVRIAKSEAERAELAYQKAILIALEDVEGALVQYVEQRKLVEEILGSIAEQERAVDLAKQRYRAGYSRLFEALTQQEILDNLNNNLAAARAGNAAAIARLYSSLGGSLNPNQTR